MQALPNLLSNVPKPEEVSRPEKERILSLASAKPLLSRSNGKESSFQDVFEVALSEEERGQINDGPPSDQYDSDTSKRQGQDQSTEETERKPGSVAASDQLSQARPPESIGDTSLVGPGDDLDPAYVPITGHTDPTDHNPKRQLATPFQTGDLPPPGSTKTPVLSGDAANDVLAPTAPDGSKSAQNNPEIGQTETRLTRHSAVKADSPLLQDNLANATRPLSKNTADVQATSVTLASASTANTNVLLPDPIAAQQATQERMNSDPAAAQPLPGTPEPTADRSPNHASSPHRQTVASKAPAVPWVDGGEAMPRADTPRAARTGQSLPNPTLQITTSQQETRARSENPPAKEPAPVPIERTGQTAGSIVSAAVSKPPFAQGTASSLAPNANGIPPATEKAGGFLGHPDTQTILKTQQPKPTATPPLPAENLVEHAKNASGTAHPATSSSHLQLPATRQQDLQPHMLRTARGAQQTISAPPGSAPVTPLVPVSQPTPANERLAFETSASDPFMTAPRADATAHSPVGQSNGPARADLPHHIMRQIAEIAGGLPNRPVDITLSPEELGRVRLSLSLTETGITVSLAAERPETMDLLRRHIDLLGQDFASLGFEDIAFDFNQNNAPATEDEGSVSASEVTEEETPHHIHLRSGPSSGLDLRL